MIIKKENRIPLQFEGKGEVRGFKFERINFSDHAFMYKRIDNEGNIAYEVFKRKLTPVCIDFENRSYSDTEFKEIYPKAKSFGVWAWCFNNAEKATRKFQSITEKI